MESHHRTEDPITPPITSRVLYQFSDLFLQNKSLSILQSLPTKSISILLIPLRRKSCKIYAVFLIKPTVFVKFLIKIKQATVSHLFPQKIKEKNKEKKEKVHILT